MNKIDNIQKLEVRASFGAWTDGETAVQVSQSKLTDYKVKISYQQRGVHFPKTYEIGYPEFYNHFLPTVLKNGGFEQRVVTHPQIVEALKHKPKTTEEVLQAMSDAVTEEELPPNTKNRLRIDSKGRIKLF